MLHPSITGFLVVYGLPALHAPPKQTRVTAMVLKSYCRMVLQRLPMLFTEKWLHVPHYLLLNEANTIFDTLN